MHCFIVFPFFSSICQMQNIWSVVDLLCQNLHWWYLIISSTYGINFYSWMLDKILYVVDKSNMPLWLLQSVSSPFSQTGTMIDSFHSTGNFSIPNRRICHAILTGTHLSWTHTNTSHEYDCDFMLLNKHGQVDSLQLLILFKYMFFTSWQVRY